MKKQKIERTSPLWLHKRVVILVLKEHPEDLKQTFPDWEGTAQELITKLTEAEEEWFVGGDFLTDAEAHKRYRP